MRTREWCSDCPRAGAMLLCRPARCYCTHGPVSCKTYLVPSNNMSPANNLFPYASLWCSPGCVGSSTVTPLSHWGCLDGAMMVVSVVIFTAGRDSQLCIPAFGPSPPRHVYQLQVPTITHGVPGGLAIAGGILSISKCSVSEFFPTYPLYDIIDKGPTYLKPHPPAVQIFGLWKAANEKKVGWKEAGKGGLFQTDELRSSIKTQYEISMGYFNGYIYIYIYGVVYFFIYTM